MSTESKDTKNIKCNEITAEERDWKYFDGFYNPEDGVYGDNFTKEEYETVKTLFPKVHAAIIEECKVFESIEREIARDVFLDHLKKDLVGWCDPYKVLPGEAALVRKIKNASKI